jgi:hypothetical protein
VNRTVCSAASLALARLTRFGTLVTSGGELLRLAARKLLGTREV